MKANDKLATTIARGRKRYLISYLGWGLFTAMIFVAGLYTSTYHDFGFLEIALPFVLFSLGGLLQGSLMWRSITLIRPKKGCDRAASALRLDG